MNLHKPTERVIKILNLIAKNPDKLIFSNVSQILEIPKSTLSPILKTLLNIEFLIQNPVSQTYSIGLAAFQIGQSYLNNINGLDLIKSHMRVIVEECNETCQLGINHRHEVLYLTKIECSQPIKLISSVGRNLPLYCTGLGRALLLDYSEEKIRKIYSKKLQKFTEYTTTDIQKLIEILKEAKINKFTFEKQEIATDACCIGVPIIINNSIQAAMGISMPVVRAKGKHLKNIINLLQLHSNLISQELSHFNINCIL